MQTGTQKAFTLIEIMVALTIIAISMGAIIENSTASARNAIYLQEKTIASWIAMNQISLVRAKREWTSVSNRKGEVEMANREWLWKMKILKTEDPDLRSLVVDVYLADDDSQVLASMIGALGRL